MYDMEEYMRCLDIIADCNHIGTEDPVEKPDEKEGEEVSPETGIEETE